MKLKVGMYVRSKVNGLIDKIANIEELVNEKDVLYYELGHKNSSYGFCSTEIDSVKASDKLIDLVEYMDLLVTENKVKDINNKEVYFFNPVRCDGFTIFENNQHCMIINMDYIIPIENIKIKQILTSEMFEQMSYKVGE